VEITDVRELRPSVLSALCVVLVTLSAGCSRPPQMGADEEAFGAVDALFTAVTARDVKLLEQCEQRLRVLREEGKLPAEAAEYLAEVGATAREGRWESAAKTLYGFMKAQRREGAPPRHDGARKKGRQQSAPR
jgi:hypothetical protein